MTPGDRLPGQAPLGGLPREIEVLDDELAALLDDAPPGTGEIVLRMVQQLHIAVHGSTWARPDSPREVWRGLLAAAVARGFYFRTGTECCGAEVVTASRRRGPWSTCVACGQPVTISGMRLAGVSA
jgi:hypothetical protein